MGDGPQPHASSRVTAHVTSSRGMKVEATDSTSRVAFVAPPPPAGPFVYHDSPSLATAWASQSVSVRAATRRRTSYGEEPVLDSRGPCSALTPIRSRRVSAVWIRGAANLWTNH